MLVHALILSLLLSLPTATLAYALSSDITPTAWCVLGVSSLVCLVCGYGELCVLSASVNGRVARAAYRPPPRTDRVIEHELPVAPVHPVALPPERLRFIPVKSSASYASVPLNNSAHKKVFASDAIPVFVNPSVHGVPNDTLRWFVQSLTTKGSHSRRKWEGKIAPDGSVVDSILHAALCEPLVKCGAITGRAPRKAGSLVMSSTEILSALGL